MLIKGTVLRVDHIVGVNDKGPYDFQQVHILDGVEVIQASIGRDFGSAPGEGEDIVAEVRVQPVRNKTTGAATLRVSLESRADLPALARPAEKLTAVPARAAQS